MKRDAQTSTKESAKKQYKAPEIRSQKVLERAALACNRAAFPNSWYNMKTSYYSCGYNDS